MAAPRPAITIRSSTAEDGARVLDVWRRAVDASHDFLSGEDRRAIDAEVAATLPAAALDVAVDREGRLLGFMLLAGPRDGAGKWHLQALFVDPDHHGSGIGRALVEDAIRRCGGRLVTDVNEQNLKARGFWERLSFVPCGRSATDGAGRGYPLIHLRYAGGGRL